MGSAQGLCCPPQASTFLPALKRCLEGVGHASSSGTAERNEQGCTWLRDLLQRGAFLVQIQHPTSSFLQQVRNGSTVNRCMLEVAVSA